MSLVSSTAWSGTGSWALHSTSSQPPSLAGYKGQTQVLHNGTFMNASDVCHFWVWHIQFLWGKSSSSASLNQRRVGPLEAMLEMDLQYYGGLPVDQVLEKC